MTLANAPSISVVIPCFNQAEYLRHALRSVLRQTYADWEAIVVDDGSIDHTAQVVGDLNEGRIRYIYQQNQGLSAARNTGVRHSQGKFLAFLDSDDEWDGSFLLESHARLSADPSLSAVYCATYFIDENGRRLPGTIGRTTDRHHSTLQLMERNLAPVNAFMVRTKDVRGVGMFDEELTSLEDWDLWLRISRIGAIEGFTDPLARYRIINGSMSANAKRMHENRLAVLAKYYGEMVGDPTTWPTLKRRLFGIAYATGAVSLMAEEPASGESCLRKAFEIWPEVLTRVETHYGLLCARQPRGYTGIANTMDVPMEADRLWATLDRTVWQWINPPPERLRMQSEAIAHLAIAMLFEQSGRWQQARTELFHAIRLWPRVLRNPTVLRRLVKLVAGKRCVHVIKASVAMPTWKLSG